MKERSLKRSFFNEISFFSEFSTHFDGVILDFCAFVDYIGLKEKRPMVRRF